ncbi:MAG TPA: cobalamin biosynthesis protein [Alphaproteobacteria bacterium]|nr:cobalamin biosynthesis protein [Alphaproteobacteria bacterium]
MKVAVGIGCRKNCPADAVEALVRQALGQVADAAPSALFTVADKQGEAGLAEAARRLRLGLTYLSRDALRGREADIQTHSPQAERLLGIPSVAEAAALVGAGPGSVLIVPRVAADGVTCAVARGAP